MARSSPLPSPALGGMVLAFLASLLSPSTKDSESVCLSGDTGPEGSPLPKGNNNRRVKDHRWTESRLFKLGWGLTRFSKHITDR